MGLRSPPGCRSDANTWLVFGVDGDEVTRIRNKKGLSRGPPRIRQRNQ